MTNTPNTYDDALKHHQAGHLAQAELLYLRVLGETPSHAGAWHFLGLIQHQRGENAEAAERIRRAIQIDGNVDIYHYNLGIVLFALHRFEESIAAYDRAVALSPQYAHAYGNRGNALKEIGRFDEAISAYEEAIHLAPDFAEAHSNLGFALRELGRIDESITACRKAIHLRPDYARAYSNLGNALRDNDQLENAISAYQIAINIDPQLAEAHGNMGTVLLEMGRIDSAIDAFQTSLRLDPHGADVHRNLSRLKIYTRDEPQFATLQRLHKQAPRERDRMHANFAFAKACEDVGEHDMAFGAYIEANRLRKKELGYRIEQDKQLFDVIKGCFSDLVSSPEPVLAPSSAPLPILIVGMPRSGSSLAEQILASHSMVHSAGELATLNSHVQAHINHRQQVGLIETSRRITNGYLDALQKFNAPRPIITDKMPLNFRWIGFLLLTRPDIRIIHTVRDRMAICWSIFKLYFPAKGLGFAFDLNDVAEFYALYEDLMRFWHARFPGRIHDLNYERLTENQEEETRKLVAYCGLNWEDTCLQFEQTKRPVRTASAMQVRQKLYQGSSESWRVFARHLAPLMEK